MMTKNNIIIELKIYSIRKVFFNNKKQLLVSEKKLKKTVIVGKATIRAVKSEPKNHILYFVINLYKY